EHYIREGRVLIGPWYVQPDEFLVSGEAHIRNLLIGHRIARRYGTIMKVGYLPDCFGHISQMPQILRGFGIDSAMFWRGVGKEITTTEFTWEAPDGSRVFTIYLRYGYSNAVELPVEEEQLLQRVDEARNNLEPWGTTRYVVFMNGSDHKYLQRDLADMIAAIRKKQGESSIRQSSMPELVRMLKAEVPELPPYRGEFRNSLRSNILPGVYSARIYLKQMNTHLEYQLEKQIEPLSTFCAMAGFEYPKDEISSMWKQLIQNNAHDSICGCSVDQVHDEMEERFEKLAGDGAALVKQLRENLCSLVDTATAGSTGGQPILVFNPLPGSRTEMVKCDLEVNGEKHCLSFIAGDVPPFGFKTYRVFTPAEGSAPEIVRLKVLDGLCGSENREISHSVLPCAHDTADDTDVRGYGAEDPVPAIENEYYRIELDRKNATLTVLDKKSGTTFTAINRFVDEGDAGDEYNFCPPAGENETVSSGEPEPDVLVKITPVNQSLTYRLVYSLPEGLSEDRSCRSAARRDCPLIIRITLYPNIRRIDFRTSVENATKDHRLRVHFPAGLKSDFSFTDGHFDVLKRAAEPAADEDYFEQPMGDFPQKSFTAVGRDNDYFVLLNKGLPEAEIIHTDGQSTIALTLIRAVGWLSRDDLATRKDGHAGPGMATPGAQCLRKMFFEYAIIPRTGTAGMKLMPFIGACYNNPLMALPTDLHEGELPSSLSFLTAEPATLMVSALKQAEDNQDTILRVFNSGETETAGT
ncbi:MAG: glycoside hydrolase family 38 C-terminal domain-containing protein, partial [bacterium]|nr:glycoside hydrolase family 38 C-terminal domain-containing protein [bacterium]